ncbi:helix-turn-helix domain-containing protein [Novosphingobium jiangmenense]|uniref:Helix-turn-helix transcriptional regulator n=1 Tax=Novosphingobium jiangmenense TaxID=2791981 RepID=A0ABS0HM03_9SPHN|nr:helix-turn-helix transcriptional regulator [Novosphingobium jiangmenense]
MNDSRFGKKYQMAGACTPAKSSPLTIAEGITGTDLESERQLASEHAKRFSGTGPFLSDRQSQVLSGVAFGLTSAEIADWLGLSRRTADIHRAHAIAKLGARNSADAVRIAYSIGVKLVVPPQING